MATIQERLQQKRVPIDTWNIREQLCLASAVVRSGDQNWMSVSRALKTVSEPNRPPDWYSQKSCAAQYGALLEHVETPKRKKRNSEGAVETPQESILKRLTQERIVEIQKNIAEMNQQYEHLKNEITEVRNLNTSEERLTELWAGVEAAKRAKERETARRAAWLKEREERRARADRTWRPQPSTPAATPPGTPVPPSSPLLTSLLKSSPVVTTPQHISHPANVVETVSPSATAPTLSMLLEKTSPTTNVVSTTQHESKHAAIEHIKNQLVQIEQQLIASTSASASPVASVPLTSVAPAVDIDDIEIKEEDVYAFRDIDIHIPPVAAMHKATPRVMDSKPAKINEEDSIPVKDIPSVQEEIVKEEPLMVVEEPAQEIMETQQIPDVPEEHPRVVEEEPPPLPPPPEPKVTIAFPEVKFPTPEIKVIHPDDQKVKEEIKEPEPETETLETEQPPEVTPHPEVRIEDIPLPTPVAEEVIEQKEEITITEKPEPEPEVDREPPKEVEEEDLVLPLDIPLPPEPEDGPEKPSEDTDEPTTEPPVEVTPEIPESKDDGESTESKEQEGQKEDKEPQREPEDEKEPKEERDDEEDNGQKEKSSEDDAGRKEDKDDDKEKRDDDDKKPKEEPQSPSEEESKKEEMKRDEDAEDSIPLKEMIKPASKAVKPESQVEEDDTPMELSREEEKDGKKKRDYSRKRKAESRSSESANEVNAPESPSSSEAEKQHRLWKKSVMLVYSRLCAHKYASLFLRPITDEEAPDYSNVVKRPMDLSTIRRNIDCGSVRDTRPLLVEEGGLGTLAQCGSVDGIKVINTPLLIHWRIESDANLLCCHHTANDDKTTPEFQRDVLLMLSNALMYNSSEHSVYGMAKEMQEEAECQLGMLLAAQAHAGLQSAPPARRKRKGRADTPPYVPPKRLREKLTP